MPGGCVVGSSRALSLTVAIVFEYELDEYVHMLYDLPLSQFPQNE